MIEEKSAQNKNIEKALKLGWSFKELSPNLEGIYEAIQSPKTLSYYFGDLLKEVGDKFSRLNNIPFPFALMLTTFDEDVKEAYQQFLSQFCSEQRNKIDSSLDINDEAVSIQAKFNNHMFGGRLRGSNAEDREENFEKAQLWMIAEIFEHLKEPDSIELLISGSSIELKYPTEDYKNILESLKKANFNFGFSDGCAISLNWKDINTFIDINISSSGNVFIANLSTHNPKQVVEEPLKGKVLMALSNNCSIGKIKNAFPLNSFSAEARSLQAEVDSIIDQGDFSKFTTLIQGEPGTGKTEWVKSYISEKLSKEGYFTYFLDVNTIKEFSPPSFLPKVCIFVNEVDNLILNRDSVKSVGDSEALLGFFDGTIYQSVQEHGQKELDQKILTFLTANTTDRLDPAFLRKGRVDLQYTFTHKYV